MTKDEALTLALKALETSMYPQQKQLQAITAIKEALAQPEQKPEQEPEACKECHLKDTVYDLLGDLKVANLKLSIRGKRTLIGLTDEEREQVINANTSTGLWHMAKDIEAKLKGKNGA